MPTDVSYNFGTAIAWADTTDYSSTESGLVRTDQIDLTSLAIDAARAGAKADLGDVRPRKYLVVVGIEFVAAPTEGGLIEVYWAGSPSSTAANANPAESSGSPGTDEAYTGTTGSTLAESLEQLQFVGAMIVTNDIQPHVKLGVIGVLEVIPRHGFPIVLNSSDQAIDSDATQMYIALIPMQDEIQD